jgi:hypothetical protein
VPSWPPNKSCIQWCDIVPIEYRFCDITFTSFVLFCDKKKQQQHDVHQS